MTELDVRTSYQQYSKGQILAVESRYQKALDIAHENLQQTTNLLWLDIGPNRGFGLKKLCLDGKVFTVDIDQEYLQEAVEENPHVKGAVMDGCHLGFPDVSLNVVSFFEVIEHMGESDQHNLLAESYRVLKPGGLLFLSTPNKVASGKRRMSPDHKRELTHEELETLLTNSGFQIIDVLGQSFLNKSIFPEFPKISN